MRRKLRKADHRILRKAATHESPLVTRVLPALGHSANYAGLWWGIAGLLAASGERRARRAALRGMIAVGVASFGANVVSKKAVRRPRPPAHLMPVVPRHRRMPVTTSFPSGHSASAAAFATGVGLEWPALAAPIGLLAAGVAASRVAAGVHYPSDVVAGAALGLGAGVLTTWWWPTTLPGPAAAGAADAVASPTGEGVVIVVNSGAGSAGEDVRQVLAERLPDAEIVRPPDETDLAKVLAEAARRARVLGAAGGDGTINVAAKTAIEYGLPLLAIPAGTLNHFARDLGVETAEEAVDALRAGTAVAVDVGCAGEQVFVNTCSTGLYTDLVRYREKWERRVGKWPAMVIGLVHLLRRAQPQHLVIDGRHRRVWMVFAGNGGYLPTGFAPANRPRLDDGRLDVRIIDAERPFCRTRVVLAMVTGTLRWCSPYENTFASTVEISAPEGDLRLTVDGEFARVAPEVTVCKLPRALTVYRPG
ncbi:phosphatase PAP2 family protein [Amycolatopsis sp. K13G38]|uniref:Phosphatase PAP2 family protein n=1 Tax=Amycolatopsis acididurans TaxID=2724524 RepID=A0ABX1IXC7_9PSEU|nr:bifunctional phosphatase PAP2/diacylglycerol kinase family protein [Amycolatopsis acididurans]NKQ52161.1 phosphatase PAP2 family protein [Amycolatopsis acididurans]